MCLLSTIVQLLIYRERECYCVMVDDKASVYGWRRYHWEILYWIHKSIIKSGKFIESSKGIETELHSAIIVPESLHQPVVLLFWYYDSASLCMKQLGSLVYIITGPLNSSERQIVCPGVVHAWTCILGWKTICVYGVEGKRTVLLSCKVSMLAWRLYFQKWICTVTGKKIDGWYWIVLSRLTAFVLQMGRPLPRSGNVWRKQLLFLSYYDNIWCTTHNLQLCCILLLLSIHYIDQMCLVFLIIGSTNAAKHWVIPRWAI